MIHAAGSRQAGGVCGGGRGTIVLRGGDAAAAAVRVVAASYARVRVRYVMTMLVRYGLVPPGSSVGAFGDGLPLKA